MTQIAFGMGGLSLVRTDIVNPTPVQLGIAQDGHIDISGEIKELYGQYSFPVGVARGKIKVTGKTKFARLNASGMDLFFGNGVTAGQLQQIDDEGPTTIPGTPFQVTAVNGATFATDRGVKDGASGLPYTRVASGPTAGQYSVNTTTGVYTFATADAARTVLLSYTYNKAAGVWPAAPGAKIILSNKIMGQQPIFQFNCNASFNNQSLTVQLNQCIATKISIPLKNDDWAIPDFEFAAFVDASGNLGSISTAES